MAAEQTVQEVATELAALNSSRQALCDAMLGASQGSARLMLRHDQAHHQMDSLISTRVQCGKLAALTSVSSLYNGMDFDVVG